MHSFLKLVVSMPLILFREGLAVGQKKGLYIVQPADCIFTFRRIQLTQSWEKSAISRGTNKDVVWNALIAWTRCILKPSCRSYV